MNYILELTFIRSSRPSTFVSLGDKVYFIASNIYYGAEVFSLSERDQCSEEDTEVITCDNGVCSPVESDSDVIIYAGGI